MIPHSRIIEPGICGTLSDDNRHRIERVLRLRPGDKFVITDGCGNEAEAVLGKNGEYAAGSWNQPNREPDVEVSLFVALSKGDRLEWIIEKAVEMGVRKIIPIISDRCLVKEPSRSKTERWQKIAESAMIQCGGCIIPEVVAPIKLFDIARPGDDVYPVLLHEETLDCSFKGLQDSKNKKIWLASGPEGGFTDAEVDFFIKTGWKTIWLGRRLFRMDTAPIFALSNILSKYLL